jgi:Flp pilus assembly protein TadG
MVGTLLFIPMMMGIMEFGVLVKNNLLVANAVREGARAASTGKTTTQIKERVTRFISPMNISTACAAGTSSCGSIQMLHSTDDFKTEQILGEASSSATTNNAPHGSLVRVTVSTRHKPLTSFFFFMNTRNIVTTVTMRRE